MGCVEVKLDKKSMTGFLNDEEFEGVEDYNIQLILTKSKPVIMISCRTQQINTHVPVMDNILLLH